MSNQCYEAYQEALCGLLSKWPFYYGFICQSPYGEDPTVPIACVETNPADTKMKIILNPEEFPRYSFKDRMFILAHEIIHIIRLHPLSPHRDHELWQIAIDMDVNSTLLAQRDQEGKPFFTLPQDPDNPAMSLGLSVPNVVRQVEGMWLARGVKKELESPGEELSALAYFEWLLANVPPEAREPSQTGEASAQGKKAAGQGSDEDQQDEENEDDQEDQDQGSNGDNQDDEDDSDGGAGDGDEPNEDDESEGDDESEEDDSGSGDGDSEDESDGDGDKSEQPEDPGSSGGDDTQEEQEEQEPDNPNGTGDQGQKGKGGGWGSGAGSGQGPTPRELMEELLEQAEHTWPDMTPEDREILKQMITQQAMAAATYAAPPGSLSSDVRELIEALKPKRSWGRVTQQFTGMLGSLQGRTTMARRNKYGKFPRYVFRPHKKILVMIDTSGSMASRWLAQAIGVIESIAKHCTVDVMQVDCEVHEVISFQEFKRRSKERDEQGNTGFAIKGRGGTSMRAGCRYVRDHKLKYDGRLVISDMELGEQRMGEAYGFPTKAELNRIPTLWIATKGNPQTHPIPPEVGPHVYMSEDEFLTA